MRRLCRNYSLAYQKSRSQDSGHEVARNMVAVKGEVEGDKQKQRKSVVGFQATKDEEVDPDIP